MVHINKSKSKKPFVLFIKKFKNNENENTYIKKINKNSNSIKNNNLHKKNDLKKHNNSIKFSPLSGSELDYNPTIWNKDKNIRETHNCYSYALGKIIKKLQSKAQPGYASGFSHIEMKDYNCKTFRNRLKKDAPASYLEKFDNACMPGFYKIFLALDVENDYHWWRQDSSGYWSHKPGSTNVIDIDASKKKIINPLLSDRNFKNRNYHTPCFFACIYSDLARSLDDIYRL